MNKLMALRRYQGLGEGGGGGTDWAAVIGAGFQFGESVATAAASGVVAAQARREAEERRLAIQAAVPWIAGAIGLVAIALILK